jgi:hypothetical protein
VKTHVLSIVIIFFQALSRETIPLNQNNTINLVKIFKEQIRSFTIIFVYGSISGSGVILSLDWIVISHLPDPDPLHFRTTIATITKAADSVVDPSLFECSDPD